MLPVAGGWGNLNGNSATMHRCVNEEHTVKGLFGRLKGTEYISVKQQATVLHDAPQKNESSAIQCLMNAATCEPIEAKALRETDGADAHMFTDASKPEGIFKHNKNTHACPAGAVTAHWRKHLEWRGHSDRNRKRNERSCSRGGRSAIGVPLLYTSTTHLSII